MAKENGTEDVEMNAEAQAGKDEDAEPTEEAKEGEEESKEEPKEAAKTEPEKPKEQEQDAEEKAGPKVAPESASINSAESTLNVMSTKNGKFLMSLTEGGFQYLLAGARSAVGVKSGRYMLEVKILECHKQVEQQGNQGRVPMPRQLVRFGLSRGGSSLLLADGSADNVSFDSEGFFVWERSRKKCSLKFERDAVVALVINLEEGSPNANTVSLFKNGQRASEPQPIPEKLRGQALFPTITYKNVTLQVNFGPAPLTPVPFKCHMLSSAAAADVEVAKAPEAQGGKPEVVFPVGLPEQGYFDWVDKFLEQNPEFTELSDRKVIEWASKSGLWRPKSQGSSNDKPDMKFGLPQMDDMSVRRLLYHVAPTAKRSFIVPEMKTNLTSAERKEALLKFPSCDFRKRAVVVVGEPTAEYKAQVQDLILGEKRSKAQAERKKQKAEEDRKRVLEEKKKKAEEARKALVKKKEGKEDDDAEAKEAEPAEEAKDEPKDMEVEVELTDEEKALWYRKMPAPDMTDAVVAKAYAEFSLPSKEEGFDEISYKWQSEAESAKIVKEWIFAKKMTQRVEDIQPGKWFKDEWAKWTKSLQEWRKRQSDWKDPAKKKAMLAARAEAKKKEAEETGEEAPQEEEPKVIDWEDLDLDGVNDVLDVGNGEPLFSKFAYEDWALLSARFELHTLLHTFRKDLDDPDRPGFAEKDLAFYYNRYFKKTWSLKNYGMDKLETFVDIVRDTIKIAEGNNFLQNELAEDTSSLTFVKLTEEHRRERQRRADAGDETAELKFPRNAPPPRQQPSQAWQERGQGRGPAAPPRGAPPPRSNPPPSYAGSASRGSSYGAAGGGGYSSGSKRTYTPSGGSSYSSSKQPRTQPSSYGSGYHRR